MNKVFWFAWMSEYPDEGSVVVEAESEAHAQEKARAIFDEDIECTIDAQLVTAEWIEAAQEAAYCLERLLTVPGVNPGPRGYELVASRAQEAVKALGEIDHEVGS